MKLDNIERQSSVWLKIRAHYEDQLISLRKQNDANLDAVDTARIRGRIAEIRRLLNIDQDDAVVIDDSFPGA